MTTDEALSYLENESAVRLLSDMSPLAVRTLAIAIATLRAQNATYRDVLKKIAAPDRAALDKARTLHYDQNGWAKRALADAETLEQSAPVKVTA